MAIKNAIKGKEGYKGYTDYIMSKRFGFNWKKQPSDRISEFLLIMELEGQVNEEESRKK